MPFEERNIGSLIADLAISDPDAPCVEQDGICHSRAEVINSAAVLVDFFKGHRVTAGASVAIVAVDRLRALEAMIALWSLDAAVLLLDPRQPIGEIQTVKEKVGLDSVFTDSKSFARRGGFDLIPARDSTMKCAMGLHFSSGSQHCDALILSSSGTTGFPRFRRVTHQAFLEGLWASGQLLNNQIPLSAVSVGSLAFGAVLSHWIKLLINGKFLLSLPLIFGVQELHQALTRSDIQSVGLPPVLITDLLEFHKENTAAQDGPAYPHITRMASLGGPISPDKLVQAYRMLTPGVKNMYSMSGVGAVSILSGDEVLEKPNSVGKPFSEVTIRIEDETSGLCPIGQIGRIVAKPNWKDGAAPIDTGDYGWIDEDGYLFIQGRSEQTACRNSINVNLLDLEFDVKRIMGVRDCIAFAVQADGSPDDMIFLAVETKIDLDRAKKQMKSSLASYRRPDRIMICSHLPRNSSNKIALRTVKNMAIEEETQFVDF
ncbi:class I adenylate-forming enzyme family protein [Parasedimentitalea marina]|nr:class I adenylate-forming enzyme family protein [Parasedimentitalea marina]